MIAGTPITFWIGFNLFVLALLALDLGVFHRKAHAVSFKEAGIWVSVWVSLALIFNVIVYFWRGKEVALEFLTGYLVEESLSVDNMFVFVLIFTFFKVPAIYQHRVLFWGIIGALVMRGIMIAIGTALVTSFHWVLYIFGAFLIFTGFRMATHKDTDLHPNDNPLVKLTRRFFPVTEDYEGQKFFVMRDGRRWATPLLMVLVLIESTDLVFALDSIPAIFGVTQNPFIVYTSNVFAILGLRSLYFLLAGSIDRFGYLKYGLSAVLIFIGFKMILDVSHIYEMPILLSLGIVGGILASSIIASLLFYKDEELKEVERIEQELLKQDEPAKTTPRTH